MSTPPKPKAADYTLPAHGWLQEPPLVFHPDRPKETDIHPLLGLLRYGPYSRSLINSVVDPIRVGVIVPAGTRGLIGDLLRQLELRHRPVERTAYLPTFTGFSNIFGLRVVGGPASTRAELPATLERMIAEAERPHLSLAEELIKAIRTVHQAGRNDCDVLLIYLPDRWARAFYGAEGEDYDLHDHVKAVSAQLGLPTQIVREGHALAYKCRASVMWRLGIALYCKAGGVPWKLADTVDETAFIGLSYAMRPPGSPGSRFVTCCSQVFDSDGAGLEFLTYDTDEFRVERENPFLSRSEMRRVMARSLRLYQLRHGGRSPKKLVVHKTSEFKKDEVEGCFDAFRATAEIDLIQVQKEVGWRGILINEPESGAKGRPHRYPCRRGSYVTLSGREVLLWSQGNVPEAAGGRDYYKEGKGIPSPLLLRRFAGHGAWEDSCRTTLGLTKMNWNNDSLYDRLPVTLAYSDMLAQVIKRVPSASNKLYEFRFFM